jgi:hypothetical protein
LNIGICQTLGSFWIRIRKDPKLFAGSGSVTWGYGFVSETGDAPYQKSSKNQQKKQFDNYDIKNVNLTFSLKSMFKNAMKMPFFIVGIVKERIFRVGSEMDP